MHPRTALLGLLVSLFGCVGGVDDASRGDDPPASSDAATRDPLTPCGSADAGTSAPDDAAIFPMEDAASDDTAASPATTCLSPAGQDPKAWTLSFHDEFEGTTLDGSVWNDHVWYAPSDPTINYQVSGGALRIWPDKGFVNRTIDTDGKYDQTYGYFEVAAKLPYGKGTWPAFWLYNHDTDGQRPEIDILEAYSGGGPSSGWSDASLHPTAYAGTIWGPTEGDMRGSKTLVTPDLSAGFHKYGAKWTPSDITFYFDGKSFATFGVALDRRMYILLDLWFGSASGTPDATTPTGPGNAYVIEYVRAWKAGGPGC